MITTLPGPSAALLPCALACALVLRSSAQELPAAVAPSAAISAEELQAHVAFLASDALEGRSTGSPGSELAARYLARELGAFE